MVNAEGKISDRALLFAKSGSGNVVMVEVETSAVTGVC
jgi:hypothetical protein